MSTPEVRSYYGRPILKAPEWTWEVPWYFFTGGLAGASSVLSLAARLARRPALARRTRMVAAAGAAVSPVLLVSDLGRPKRFLNMLRVFKPTSAMSVGSWVLAAYSGAASASGALDRLGRWPRLRALFDVAAGLLGLPMATYTAVLVADTSIPVWHEARAQLPFVFAGSAAASAGAVAMLVADDEFDAAIGRRLAVGGVAAEVVADAAMRRRLGELGEVYDQGDAGRYHRLAAGSSAAGAMLLALGGRRRGAVVAGASLVLAGGVAQRWAVYRAGFQSAADPRYVVKSQREALDT